MPDTLLFGVTVAIVLVAMFALYWAVSGVVTFLEWLSARRSDRR